MRASSSMNIANHKTTIVGNFQRFALVTLSLKEAMDHTSDQPWGRLTGLLAAAGAMLIGVLRNLDPDVILQRALISGLVVGIVVGLLSRFLHSIGEDN